MQKSAAKKLSRNIVPLIGLGGFLSLYIHKKSTEKKLKSAIIDQVLQTLRDDPEIMEAFGGDLRIRTNMMSAIRTRMNFSGPFGEGQIKLSTPKGPFTVTFNGSSHVYKDILESSNSNFHKAKFHIPDQELVEKIRSISDPKVLEKTPLDPLSRFWAIDFINVYDKKYNFTRKPSPAFNPDEPLPAHTTLHTINTEVDVNLSEKNLQFGICPPG